jgi:hypothetical protein
MNVTQNTARSPISNIEECVEQRTETSRKHVPEFFLTRLLRLLWFHGNAFPADELRKKGGEKNMNNCSEECTKRVHGTAQKYIQECLSNFGKIFDSQAVEAKWPLLLLLRANAMNSRGQLKQEMTSFTQNN